ncbi:S41 family peptidase [Phocaeicola fibrisolvens]|uniref:S41 family peptidase n=1 Tax=Phocaeicola fibrisolvens TaxID=2981793 RepID=UPI000821148F|nr:S41 family peptidase [Phocaeicola fibrisolvens]MCU6777781.1 S41 family peptidase [Phocaeicola fibrisolvens]SCH54006.1 Peptidase family S41 [uncultured Bacteroides sp.]
MKRNYILFQILLIIAGLTFYSCSVETKSLSTEQAYAELKLPEEPDSLQIHAIVQASRIWGFAKYHHPAFASRSINADAEYFCLLNEVLQAPDSMKNDICLKWISGLGPYAIRDKEDDENIETFNDFNWISDSLHLGKALSDSLMRLRNADPENNRYVKQTPVNVSYIETQYSDIPKDDVAYRLLGVAKFWNAVDSYSPNRNLTDRPWDDVLAEYIALAFDRSISFSALYSRMVSELCDTHVNSWYVPIFGGRFVPLMCQFAEDRLFVTDTCSLVPNNFEIGDEIILIDSVSPIKRLDELAPYIPHSNRSSLLRDGSYATLLTAKNEACVEYVRGGKTYTTMISSVDGSKFVNRRFSSQNTSTKPGFKEVAGGIGYINISNLTCKDEQDLENFLASCDKLIIDLRAYPAEYDVLHKLLPTFFFSQAREAAEVLLPQAHRPGGFIRTTVSTRKTSDPDKLYKGKVVLLVNAYSQSMSEYFTMFLQTIPGSVTVGSQTAGADGDVTRIQLPYASFNITGAGICYPDGTNAQRNGVKIDKVVEPSAEGMIRGVDEQLQAAIDYLQGGHI